MDDIDNLEKLAKLRDRNILNEEEYVSLKQAIISRHVDYKGGAKSGVAYVVLGWLLGLFGVHNYYAGYYAKSHNSAFDYAVFGIFVFYSAGFCAGLGNCGDLSD